MIYCRKLPYYIKYRKTADFGQADGLSRVMNNRCSPHEEPVIASVTVGSNVRLVLPNSILHTPISADVVAEEKVCFQEEAAVWWASDSCRRYCLARAFPDGFRFLCQYVMAHLRAPSPKRL